MIYSYTQISQYLTCPRRYRHRYLDGWQEKDTRAAMLFGRAFERALAAYFLRQDPAAVLFQEWKLYQDQKVEYSHGDTWDRMLEQGIQLLERFCQDDRVRIPKPRGNLQIKFTQQLSAANEFVAFIDAIGQLDGRRSLIEWKTTASRYSEAPDGLLALDPQLVCYSWMTGIADVAMVVFCAQAAGGSAISADHDYRGAAPGIRRAGEGYHPADRVGPVSAAQRHSLSTEPLQQLSLYRTLPRTSIGGRRFGAAARSRKSWLA